MTSWPMSMRLAIQLTLSLTISISIATSTVRGDTESQRTVLGPGVKGVDVGPGMNLAGRDLRGTRLTGHDLSGAVLDGCNLFDVEIYQCDLTGASLKNVVFHGGSVIDCHLVGADLTDAVINFNGVLFRWDRFRCVLELSWEQFKSTRSYKTKKLDHCVLLLPDTDEPLDFLGGDLTDTWLIGADLTKGDFTNVDLIGTSFLRCKVAAEQLASTRDFRRRRVQIRLDARDDFGSGLDLSGINLDGSILQNIPDDWTFAEAQINGATLVGLTKQQLRSTASYKLNDLSRVVLASIDLSNFAFDGINLTGARFGQCRFHHASFTDAVITGVNFAQISTVPIPHGCEGLDVDQLKESWNFRHGQLKTVTLPSAFARDPHHDRIQLDQDQ